MWSVEPRNQARTQVHSRYERFDSCVPRAGGEHGADALPSSIRPIRVLKCSRRSRAASWCGVSRKPASARAQRDHTIRASRPSADTLGACMVRFRGCLERDRAARRIGFGAHEQGIWERCSHCAIVSRGWDRAHHRKCARFRSHCSRRGVRLFAPVADSEWFVASCRVRFRFVQSVTLRARP